MVLAAASYLWVSSGFSLWVGVPFGSAVALLVLLSFSEAGIHFRTTGIDSRIDWALYSSWVADEEFAYLFYGKRDLTVVPLRVFQSEAEVADFRALVQGRVASDD